jgi:hypothetical protein
VLDGVAEPKAWLKYHEFGTSPDILALDGGGRLIVAEAKPASYQSGIGKGPIQARFYAGLIARWLELSGAASAALGKMLAQRIAVGLDRGSPVVIPSNSPVVPVLAIGPGELTRKRREHALDLRDALAGVRGEEAGRTSAIEIWRLDGVGNVVERW